MAYIKGMSNQLETAKAIEVWLRKSNIEVICKVVFDDESGDELSIDSLSLRGAQREITAWFIAMGFEPAGRWQDEGASGELEEVSRKFRRARDRAAGPAAVAG
jgi:hypothetical protein